MSSQKNAQREDSKTFTAIDEREGFTIGTFAQALSPQLKDLQSRLIKRTEVVRKNIGVATQALAPGIQGRSLLPSMAELRQNLVQRKGLLAQFLAPPAPAVKETGPPQKRVLTREDNGSSIRVLELPNDAANRALIEQNRLLEKARQEEDLKRQAKFSPSNITGEDVSMIRVITN